MSPVTSGKNGIGLATAKRCVAKGVYARFSPDALQQNSKQRENNYQ
jgi:hypothetical protein